MQKRTPGKMGHGNLRKGVYQCLWVPAEVELNCPRPLLWLLILLVLALQAESKQDQNQRPRAGGRTGHTLWLVLFAAGVVSGAGLDFIALLVLDFKLAVGAVELGVGGGIADVVLAAQFGGDLVKSFSELVELVAHVDHAAAGLLGELAHFGLARIAKAAE